MKFICTVKTGIIIDMQKNDLKPKLTVSGYRGIWGDSLNEEIVRDYTRAFLKFVKEKINSSPTILIGRDGRESGPIIKKEIIKVFEEEGIKFIDGDILPTPTVLFSVRKHKYDGAIIITASHNPREYNGLKFVTNKALFTNEQEVEEIKKNLDQISNRKANMLLKCLGSATARLARAGTAKGARGIFQQKNIRAFQKHIGLNDNFPKKHANQILKNIDVELIKSKKWRVGVDMINASACVLDPYLFEKLGVELVPLNDIPNGIFGHKPEPLRENLADIGNIVKEKKCDLGFAHDPDADRLVIINEDGEAVFEEYTLAFGVEAIMSRPKNHSKNVVINMSSSRMSEDIATKYGGKCLRSKVGEANVVSLMEKCDAIVGGEGGGGIIYPTINMARDSFVSLALILELLAKRNQNVSECISSLPKYEMMKDKVPVVGSLEEMYEKMKNHFTDYEINDIDGLRLDFKDKSWIHLRPSNTEPIVRLYGEATTKERIDGLFKETKEIIS